MDVDINKGLCFRKITDSSVKNGLERRKEEIEIGDCVLQ